MSISASPDRFDIAKGDEIAWTILLENDGDGTAYGIVVNATLLQGLQLVDIDSPKNALNWCYASLAPGQREQVKLKARAVSTQGSYSGNFQARWGQAPCQDISQLSELGARTALKKEPDQPRSLAVDEVAGFEISADLPSGAHDLWINDSIPRGLIYNRSSLSVQGMTMQSELIAENSDSSRQICWFFGDAGPAQHIEILYNCLLANVPENQDGAILAGTEAAMSWQDGPARKTDADEAGILTVIEPELVLEMQASRPFAAPGDGISFTLAVYHSAQSHAPAFDVDLQALLPAGMAYEPGSAELVAGPDAAFDGEGISWHFDALDQEWNADKKAVVRFNTTCRALPGEQIEGRAQVTWTSRPGANAEERTGEGGLNDYLRETTARVSVMSLTLTKTADPDPVQVGELLTYTLTYENQGNEARNVTIHDDLDPGVTFISADPAPSGNCTWNFSRLASRQLG